MNFFVGPGRRRCSKKEVSLLPFSVYQVVSWVPQEDRLLLKLVHEDGMIRWCDISLHFQGRCGKQCSERQADVEFARFNILD